MKKIIVNKNAKIFEGKVYKKENLMLKEASGVTASITGANNLDQARVEAQKTINSNGNVSSVVSDAGKLDGVQNNNSGEGMTIKLPTNATSSEMNVAKNAINNQGTRDASIEFSKPGIHEMKERGITFTKQEMDRFLKTL